MAIQFLGGATEVGRLGMLLRTGSAVRRCACGMLPNAPPAYPMKAPPVDRLFVSHAHLDHSGMVPWICGRSETEVILTPPTADVADLLQEDSLKIANLEGFESPYDASDIQATRRSSRVLDFGDIVEVEAMEITLHPAGHTPGATMVE